MEPKEVNDRTQQLMDIIDSLVTMFILAGDEYKVREHDDAMYIMTDATVNRRDTIKLWNRKCSYELRLQVNVYKDSSIESAIKDQLNEIDLPNKLVINSAYMTSYIYNIYDYKHKFKEILGRVQ
jgi:hypothetical protein